MSLSANYSCSYSTFLFCSSTKSNSSSCCFISSSSDFKSYLCSDFSCFLLRLLHHHPFGLPNVTSSSRSYDALRVLTSRTWLRVLPYIKYTSIISLDNRRFVQKDNVTSKITPVHVEYRRELGRQILELATTYSFITYFG